MPCPCGRWRGSQRRCSSAHGDRQPPRRWRWQLRGTPALEKGGRRAARHGALQGGGQQPDLPPRLLERISCCERCEPKHPSLICTVYRCFMSPFHYHAPLPSTVTLPRRSCNSIVPAAATGRAVAHALSRTLSCWHRLALQPAQHIHRRASAPRPRHQPLVHEAHRQLGGSSTAARTAQAVLAGPALDQRGAHSVLLQEAQQALRHPRRRW